MSELLELLDFFAMPRSCPKCGGDWLPARFKQRTLIEQKIDRQLAVEASDLRLPADSVACLARLADEPLEEWLEHRCKCGYSLETKTKGASQDPDDVVPPDPNVGPDRGGWKFW